MRCFDFSILASIFLLAQPLSALRGSDRSLQGNYVVRTDLIRLIPFQVQMAIQDETIGADSELIADTLYSGGTLLTDTITDWMMASFVTKTSGEQAEQLILSISNYTSFDSIALELVDDSASTGTIDGNELELVQLSLEGVTLWERIGTGTPPMDPEIVELIQRATFLENRSLKTALQTSINNLLFNLGIDSVDGVQPISIVDVRAYIVPPGSFGSGGDDEEDDTESTPAANTPVQSTANKNLEMIIVVAIVVACLAFALLVFAVVWAWKSDRRERGNDKPQKAKKEKKAKEPEAKTTEKPKRFSRKEKQATTYLQAPAEPSVEAASSYDLPHNDSEGSYPRVIGKSGNDSSAYPEDSVVSEDISSSLTAYYKSGMGYGGSKAGTAGSREPKHFNDAASISSMDSYGYSLDGYAPSLGPTQGGYPVGPMAAARDAPMPVGDANVSDEVEDYGA
mmetsp:Transcript_16302/g.33593  ORF Transcript_16302/g.33593 Transcript_16302/m.33593 type:complete len:453 (+) Transcript_16302:275-1633(+)|eukprot:CAMPEP_0197267418 /NCGR_PEP_ID=MMETSP1432-20130617/3571_1 /TAXON_ID=44447 /ORGANISM="Pseudo-nitzschia delicatissima, Strain UNC1205" /LENGTH=452 /DNA_ID=CAMNT_0042732369 /DNA_START=235 /DNA_END=1593 /DNA_ORIENTATION=-